MDDESRTPRGRPSREYDFRRWGEPGEDAAESGLGERPSPWPRERSDGDAMPAAEFDTTAGASGLDEPHRFDISTYRSGLYGGPGAELIGDS